MQNEKRRFDWLKAPSLPKGKVQNEK